MEETKSETIKTPRPDRKGFLHEYESIYLLPADQTDDAADRLAERLRAVVAHEGGRVIKFTQWGRRKTAFEVAHAGRALYVHMVYLGGGKTVSEVERHLKNSEEVAKFQTGLVKKFVDPETRPTEPDVKLSGDVDERPGRAERSEGDVRSGVPDDLEGIPDDLSDDGAPEALGRE